MLPSLLTDTPEGSAATLIVAVTVFVATLITDTELSFSFVIYAVWAEAGNLSKEKARKTNREWEKGRMGDDLRITILDLGFAAIA